MPICEIAAELGVKYLVEGSLRRNGDTLADHRPVDRRARGHARLVEHLPPPDHRPAERRGRHRRVGSRGAEDRTWHRRPAMQMQRRERASRDAYESYLQGVSELRNYTDPSSLDRAMQTVRGGASPPDPTFAEAYAGLCEARVQRYMKLETVADVGDAERACAAGRAARPRTAGRAHGARHAVRWPPASTTTPSASTARPSSSIRTTSTRSSGSARRSCSQGDAAGCRPAPTGEAIRLRAGTGASMTPTAASSTSRAAWRRRSHSTGAASNSRRRTRRCSAISAACCS